jgi:hypothetical protein
LEVLFVGRPGKEGGGGEVGAFKIQHLAF